MHNPPLVLLVDDEPDFLEIFGTKIGSLGVHVETAKSGEECLKKAEDLSPDLILLDMQMPVMTGADTLLKLREKAATKNIKTVFLSSLGGPQSEIQELNDKFSKELGAAGYLRKTDDLDILAGKIKLFLG